MRISSLTFLLLLLLTACTSPTPIETPQPIAPSSTPQSLSGTWMGTAQKPDGSTASLILNLDAATLNIEPFTRAWDIEISQVDSEFQFSIDGEALDPFQKIEFTGSISNGIIDTTLSWDGISSQSIFVPIQKIAEEIYTQYEGLYKFESGRHLSIIVSPEYSSSRLEFFSKTLMMTDFETGALRALYPLEENSFAVGVLRVIGAPFDGRLQFTFDDTGNANGLMWWDEWEGITPSSTSGEHAERVPFTQEKVTFTSGDGTKLAGLLSIPDSSGPHPTFMMLHGSEPGAKDNFGNITMMHYMLSQGIAILNYDKRGVGDSEGKYQEAASQANLQRHADDATAGVQYLLTRPEIDAKKIGLIGFSQAGWIIPLAASQSADISFFVALSSPVASTAQEDKFSAYTDDSYSAREYDDALITQQLREMRPSGFDPMPIIAELNQRGLWLWGSVDKSVPTTFSAENLQVIIDSGKDNFSYQIFPNGDHNLNESRNGLFVEIPYSPGFLYASALRIWLQENILGIAE